MEKEFLYSLIEVTGKHLGLYLDGNNRENEFNEVYAYLGYNLEIHENTLSYLGIDGASDLQDFYNNYM